MGACLCATADAAAPREALRFHAEAKGAQVRLDAQGRAASRRATFHDGIVFSQRPVRRGERVALRVLRCEGGWRGGLRVGFTRLDPARVCAPSLPPFLCPDLEAQSATWAAVLPGAGARAGDVVRFWVSRRGRLRAQVNAGAPLLLRGGVLTRSPLWAVMDVYGTTKAIELLDPAASLLPTAQPWLLGDEATPEPEGGAEEECVICFHRVADARLVPCGHAHFCSSCAWRVYRDVATCPLCRRAVEAVASAWGPRAPRPGAGS
ncbi:E3 ubiquitin-protein ligase NEURL3 [Dasypus novemcinctus]|uniref:E3 ubiquitin-protein ligase NEURL3 n=1 Tax=Dasypus novemcinctus TaxID=9361 RepID=UPI00265EAC83|nr:E3 ubiquitin-protein ligase NEURL3 [Dasypus novemcinctus]